MVSQQDRQHDGGVDGTLDAATLRVVHDELDRRRSALASRWSTADTKSALLVTAAGVLIALQARDGANLMGESSAAISCFAALLGVVSLWPRRAAEIDIGATRDLLLPKRALDAELELVDTKIDVHEKDEKSLGFRSWIIRYGFALLGLAASAAALSVILR